MTQTTDPRGEAATRRRMLLLATMLMVTAAFLNAVDAVIVRVLTRDLHPFVIGFFRALFGLMAVLPFMLRKRGILATSYRWLHGLRAGLKLLSLVAFFMAIAAAPLADVTAIMFAAPIFVTMGAWVFLGERARLHRILAVVIGFLGVLVILRPGQAGLDPLLLPALGFALLGALLTAVIQLMLKAMAKRDRTETLVAWNLILTVPLGLLPALWFWTTPTLTMLLLLAIQGVIGAVNMTGVTKAFSMAEASYLAPLDFMRLPFVAILSFAFFQEVAGISTWVGAGVIFVATLLMQGPARFWRTRGM